MASLSQMNVRMESQLKVAGDNVLARMGVTPTQLVRAVWMKVAQGAEAFDQIVAVLAEEPAAVSGVSGGEGPDAVSDEFEERLQLFYCESGFDYSAYSSPTDDEWEDLLLRERADREAERMVGHGE